MGFDIQGFIAKVEEFVNAGQTERQGKTNGQLDTYEKASLFNNKELLSELKDACEGDVSVQQQVQNDLGISLSSVNSRIQELDDGAKSKETRGVTGTAEGDDGVKIVEDKNGGIVIYVDARTWVDVGIHIEVNDLTQDKIKQLLAGFKSIMDGTAKNLQEGLVNDLKAFFKENTDNVLQFLKGMFNTIYDGQKTTVDLIRQVLKKLSKQGATIDNIDSYLQPYLKELLTTLKESNYKIDTLIELVKENNKDTKAQNNIMSLVYDELHSLRDNLKRQFNSLMQKLDTMYNDKKVSDEQYYNLVLAMLKQMQADNNTNADKIIKSVSTNADKIISKLAELDQNFNKYGDDIKGLLTQIATREIVVNVDVDVSELTAKLDEITEKLKSIDEHTGNTEKYQKQILEAIDKLGSDITVSLGDILDAVGNDTAKLDEIIKLLAQLDEHNTEQNKEILEAIRTLGVDITGAIDKIVEKMPDKEDLTNLTDLLKQMDANRAAENKAILDAIAGLGDKADSILGALKDLHINVNPDFTEVIKAINTAGNTLDSSLKSIFGALGTINANFESWIGDGEHEGKAEILAQRIIDTIKDVTMIEDIDGTKKPTTVLILQLLQSISNGDIIIKVDGNGCKCCENSGTKPNEGIRDDFSNLAKSQKMQKMTLWDDILNNSITGINDVQTNTANTERASGKKVMLKNGNEYGLPQGIYIIKGEDIYNTSGQKVR